MTKQPLNVMENLAIVPDPTIADKGFYVANLTTSEMLAFKPSSNGVIIFNIDTNLFMTCTDEVWVNLAQSSPPFPTFPPLTVPPVNAVLGQGYLDITSTKIRVWMGNGWGTIPYLIQPNENN